MGFEPVGIILSENRILIDLIVFLILVLPVILYFTLQESSSRQASWGKRKVDKYLNTIVEVGLQDDSLSQEEHFSRFIKSMGFAINNAEMDNEAFYNQIEFFIQLLDEDPTFLVVDWKMKLATPLQFIE